MSESSPYAYKRVKYALTELLRQNKWQHSQAIPSEPLLAARFQVSVGTIRRAVNELVIENILIREQGRGTFVVSRTSDYMLNAFFRIESHQGKRELPSSKLLSFEKVKATNQIASTLKLKPREAIYRVRTLLSIKNKPALVDETYLPVRLFANLKESYFSDRDGTLYGLFQQVYGITVLNIHETIEAQSASEGVAQLLGMKAHSPILCVRRVAFAYKGLPIDMRTRYIHSEKYRYFNNLGGG